MIAEALKDFLSSFPALTEAEVETIGQALCVQEYAKGTVLLKEGEVSKECYFVLKGCVRQYHIVDGIEKTTAFYTEGQSVVAFSSSLQQVPAGYYLCCTEPVILIAGATGAEQEMYQRFPKLESITRSMMEQDMGNIQKELNTFRLASPEERYRNLLQNRPDLLQRVPQHQLASYIGVTPESFSRIRKRITRQK